MFIQGYLLCWYIKQRHATCGIIKGKNWTISFLKNLVYDVLSDLSGCKSRDETYFCQVVKLRVFSWQHNFSYFIFNNGIIHRRSTSSTTKFFSKTDGSLTVFNRLKKHVDIQNEVLKLDNKKYWVGLVMILRGLIKKIVEAMKSVWLILLMLKT